SLPIKTLAVATDRLTLLLSTDGAYAVSASDGSIMWHADIHFGAEFPMVGAATDTLYFFFPESSRLIAINDQTHETRWERRLTIDRLEPPKLRKTKSNGDVLIARTDTSIQA